MSEQQRPSRILPENEAGRYEFHDYPDIYRAKKRMGRRLPGEPLDFYARAMMGRTPPATGPDFTWQILTEMAWYEGGCPYCKVWPDIAAALRLTSMDIGGEHLRLPFTAFTLRFPTTANPLWPVRSMLVAYMPIRGVTAGQIDLDPSQVMQVMKPTFQGEWTLLCAVDLHNALDPLGTALGFSVSVRPGLSLEESLRQVVSPEGELGSHYEQCRDALRVAVGASFFMISRHELVLPDLRRKVQDRLQQQRRPPTDAEVEAALADAKRHGLNGYKVGSELRLPAPLRHTGPRPGATGTPLSAGHIRRGHMRWQRSGPGLNQCNLIFIPPTLVRPDLPLGGSSGYKMS
jgi:hypothetical protein